MRRAIVDGNHQRLAPTAKHAEQVTRANLAVGGLEYATQARSIVPVLAGRRRIEQVTQGLFKRIVHGHLA
ncbi:hypothetical protein D3C81_2158380 [compost metagenome]